MAMDSLGAAFSAIGLIFQGGGTFQRFLNYPRDLGDKMEDLRTKMETLNSREKDIKEELSNANGRKKKNEVGLWLKNLNRQRNEVQVLERKAAKRRYISRLQFLEKVEKKIRELHDLRQAGEFPNGIFFDQTGAAVRAIERKVNQIVEWLGNDMISRVGIYGAGGAGKTTIVTRIQHQLQESGAFNHVYMVTIPRESNLLMLHDGIANALHFRGLENEQDPRRRAAKLSNALKVNGKFALILDDMPQDFPLQDIGIPTEVEGNKLVITSQSLEICQRMGCQQCAEVQPLSPDESWDLFKQKLGPEKGLSQEVEALARSIAKKCAGLPLAVITTARRLRDLGNNDIRQWRLALQELQQLIERHTTVDMEFVFNLLQFSYNRLKDETLQLCFLYCALFPEDYKIERKDLIAYWITEGLIDEIGSRHAEFDKGHSVLNKLEEACLLERTWMEPSHEDYHVLHVAMHDVIRDMALSITKVEPRFLVKAGAGMTRFPNQSEWSENLEKVSLMGNTLRQLPEVSPRCLQLQTLFLRDNFIFELPGAFFVHMRSLRVLDLSGLRIYSLPASISNLENLRGLYLNSCSRLSLLPSFEKLTELKDLDLTGSGLCSLPDGMDKLVKLKRVDLYRTGIKRWPSAPRDLLSNLSHLQHLRSDDVYIGHQDQHHLDSITSLRQVEVLGAAFFYPLTFNKYVESGHWQRLRQYHLGATSILGGARVRRWEMQGRLNCRRVYMESCDFKERRQEVPFPLALPTNVQELVFLRCHDLYSLSDMSGPLKRAISMERCWIGSCDGITHLWEESSSVGSQISTSNPTFRNLRVLILFQLVNLDVVFKYQPPQSKTFCNLKIFSIGLCHNLKYVFTPEMVLYNLKCLEAIHVHNSDNMEAILLEEQQEEEAGAEQRVERDASCRRNTSISDEVTLPKLKSLELDNLPSLKSIWKGTMDCKSLQRIVVRNCWRVKRLPDMGMRSHMSQLKIFGTETWWESLEWEQDGDKMIFQQLFDKKAKYTIALSISDT